MAAFKEALRVTCPMCNAGPGTRCKLMTKERGSNRKYTKVPHHDRLAELREFNAFKQRSRDLLKLRTWILANADIWDCIRLIQPAELDEEGEDT